MTRAHKKTKKLPVYSPIGALGAMLESCRPAGSVSVQHFLDDWIVPLGAKVDKAGNAIVRVGDSRVMWSSHTDTVHATGGRQRVVVNGDRFKLGFGSMSSCLGADCTTGVWLMREMILAGVHGLYVFHDSEEIGGKGSQWLAANGGKLFDGVDFCIAFDRKGTDSVITHQFGSRCCSDLFVDSIAKLLPFETYKADSTGTFTDSANYVDVIGECTNLSVGYYDQHTKQETQSVKHALAMREAMLRFDESKLVASRVAGEVDLEDSWGWRFGSGFGYESSRSSAKASANRVTGWSSYDSMLRFIKAHPELVADFLEDMGVGAADLWDYQDQAEGYYSHTYGGRHG